MKIGFGYWSRASRREIIRTANGQSDDAVVEKILDLEYIFEHERAEDCYPKSASDKIYVILSDW